MVLTVSRIQETQYSYKIPSLREYLRSMGYLTAEEKGRQLGIGAGVLCRRRRKGTFEGVCLKTSNGGDYMYEP